MCIPFIKDNKYVLLLVGIKFILWDLNFNVLFFTE